MITNQVVVYSIVVVFVRLVALVAHAGYHNNIEKKDLSLGRDSSPRPLPHWSGGLACASDTQAPHLAPYQGNALPG